MRGMSQAMKLKNGGDKGKYGESLQSVLPEKGVLVIQCPGCLLDSNNICNTRTGISKNCSHLTPAYSNAQNS